MSRGATERSASDSLQSDAARPESAFPGLEFRRVFSREGIDPFDDLEWDTRSAVIGGEHGDVVFE